MVTWIAWLDVVLIATGYGLYLTRKSNYRFPKFSYKTFTSEAYGPERILRLRR